MRPSRMRSQMQGHRVPQDDHRDINHKLTYHQLLAMNHDLSRENLQLKNIGNRLGAQLRNLHQQFDLHPRDENAELYAAINAHPILQRMQNTLLPLLDTYELAIQKVEGQFERINDEFVALEKKYELIVDENNRLRTQLTQKITEVIELYRGGSQKLGGDFGQMILQQVNQKQRVLVQENAKLQREAQRSRADLEKHLREVTECKKKLEQATLRAQRAESKHQQLTKQNKFLKDQIISIKTNQSNLQSQNKQLACELERAESQVSFLNKNKEGLVKNIERLRQQCQQKENSSYYQTTENKSSLETKRQNSSIGNNQHQHDDESHKKILKLQKQNDQLTKENNKLKDQFEQSKIPLEEAQDKIAELQKKLLQVERAKDKLQSSNLTNQKKFQQLRKKSQQDHERLRHDHNEQIQTLKNKQAQEVRAMQSKISALKGQIQESNIKLLRYEDQAQADKANKQVSKGKQKERTIVQMRKKIAASEQKLQDMQHQLSCVKEQAEQMKEEAVKFKQETQKIKNESQKRNELLRNTKYELQTTKKNYEEVKQQKQLLTEQINRVRVLYETSLKDKEKLFDQKIKQIRTVVQQSDRRRKQDKQEVEKASRQYKRVLQQIRATYEERIKVLEGELLSHDRNRRDR